MAVPPAHRPRGSVRRSGTLITGPVTRASRGAAVRWRWAPGG